MDLIIVWVAILVLGGIIVVTKWAFPKKVAAGLSLVSVSAEASPEGRAATVQLAYSGLPAEGEQALETKETAKPAWYLVALKPSSRRHLQRRLPKRLRKAEPMRVVATNPFDAKESLACRHSLGTKHFMALRLEEVA